MYKREALRNVFYLAEVIYANYILSVAIGNGLFGQTLALLLLGNYGVAVSECGVPKLGGSNA